MKYSSFHPVKSSPDKFRQERYKQTGLILSLETEPVLLDPLLLTAFSFRLLTHKRKSKRGGGDGDEGTLSLIHSHSIGISLQLDSKGLHSVRR